MSCGIALFCIMPPPDLLQDEIECAQGQASIRSANGDAFSGQKERYLPYRRITVALSFEVISQGGSCICR